MKWMNSAQKVTDRLTKPGENMWKKAAQMAILTLAIQGAEETGVEAIDTNQTASGNTELMTSELC